MVEQRVIARHRDFTERLLQEEGKELPEEIVRNAEVLVTGFTEWKGQIDTELACIENSIEAVKQKIRDKQHQYLFGEEAQYFACLELNR